MNGQTDKQAFDRQGFLARFRPGNYLIDPKFARNKARYIAQCGFVSVAMILVLLMLDERTVRILLGAAAVGLAMFIMVTTDTEHPPGAAVSLGFVLNDWEPMTVGIVMVGIVTISVIKELARDRLMDLL